jgi:hypothetical protein
VRNAACRVHEASRGKDPKSTGKLEGKQGNQWARSSYLELRALFIATAFPAPVRLYLRSPPARRRALLRNARRDMYRPVFHQCNTLWSPKYPNRRATVGSKNERAIEPTGSVAKEPRRDQTERRTTIGLQYRPAYQSVDDYLVHSAIQS